MVFREKKVESVNIFFDRNFAQLKVEKNKFEAQIARDPDSTLVTRRVPRKAGIPVFAGTQESKTRCQFLYYIFTVFCCLKHVFH